MISLSALSYTYQCNSVGLRRVDNIWTDLLLSMDDSINNPLYYSRLSWRQLTKMTLSAQLKRVLILHSLAALISQNFKR